MTYWDNWRTVTSIRGLLSRGAYLSQLLRYSRLRVQLLRALPVPDALTKAHLAKSNRRYSTRVEAYAKNSYRLFLIPMVLEAFVLLVLVTAELFLLFRPDDNEALATFVAIWVLLIMFRRITRGIGGEFDWRQRVAGLSVIPVVLGFVVGASFFVLGILLQSIWPNTVSQVQVIKLIGRSFLQAAVLLPTYVAGILIATTITVYLERLLRRARVPELGIIAELQILLAMSLNGGRWVEFRHKRGLLRRLETAAYCIEGGLPKRLRTGDIATDNWHRDQARQMAAAFRQLKRLVVNPGLESRAQFVQRIMDSYTYAVRGEWGLLDKREPEVITRPQHFARLVAVIRSLIIGVLPFSLVLLVQQSSMAIEGSAANYLKAGAILWGLVTILSLLDANYAARVSAVKDLAGLLTTKDSGSNSE